jgi:hypothetical protein
LESWRAQQWLLTASVTASVIIACGTPSASSAPVSQPNFPGWIRAVTFKRPPTAADSTFIARYGRVVAIVRADSVALIESDAIPSQLREDAGIARIGQPLWESDTGRVFVYLTRRDGAVERARAVLEALGAEIRPTRIPNAAWIGGGVPAYRLGQLDDLVTPDDYDEVYVSTAAIIPMTH